MIHACSGVTGATVYGVEVPGTEGRAGMAAITVDGSFELTALAAILLLGCRLMPAPCSCALWASRQDAFVELDETLFERIQTRQLRD